MLKSNPNSPTFVFDDLPLHWQMTRCEKYAFSSLLEKASPEVAIEIGTYKGGSLQLIAGAAKRVYSIDISPSCKEDLGKYFDNVEFRTGESSVLFPKILDQIRTRKENLGFVLIDGDHTADGVRADIDCILAFVPTCPLYVVLHDSFNPECRRGIVSAAWASCPHVHYVEIDFIPGVYHFKAFDTAPARSMYGGLSVALLLPEVRKDELIIHQSQEGLFETVRRHSCYVSEQSILGRLRKWFSR